MRCAVESLLTTPACLLRHMVMVAGDSSEQTPGLSNWHAHLANTALRRGDSKVGHLRQNRYMLGMVASMHCTCAGGA